VLSAEKSEGQQGIDAVTTILERAIGAARWTAQDARELAQASSGLSADERATVYSNS